MVTPKQVTYEGKVYEAEPVSIVTNQEGTSVYTLADGNTVEFRVVVLGIARLVGIKDQQGLPVYWISSHNIARVKPKT